MDFKYNIGEPFLGIGLDYTPDKVKMVLGEPDAIDKYFYPNTDKKEYDETYFYNNDKLRIVFSYEKNAILRLTIYTKKLIVKKANLFSLSKQEVLDTFAKLSKVSIKNAYKETVTLDGYNSVEYEFKPLGIVLWFEGEFLDEVCIFNPNDEALS